MLNTHLLDCAKQNAETAAVLHTLTVSQAAISADLKEIKATPWIAVRYLGGIIGATAAVVLGAVILSHWDTQKTVEKAAVSAQTAAVQASAANVQAAAANAKLPSSR